jgi:hypothetical protein
MTECACFSSALQISEHLQRTESGLAYASFDQVLTVARQASVLCRQYAACPSCTDPSYFTIYVVILRKAAACYAHLIRSSNLAASPATSSTTSSTGSSSLGSQGSYTRLRIGAFEIEAPLDEQTRAIILRTEVRRALEAAMLLESVLGHHSVKPTVLRADEATVQYQRGLVATVKSEVGNLEQYLQSI